MNWLCWHVGTVSDPKFGRIADACKTPRANVIAIWAMILESAKDGAGEYTLNPNDAAYALGIEAQDVIDVHEHMVDRGIVDGLTVCNWEGRQHQKSTERVRKHRERTKRAETDETVSSVTERSIVTETDETPTDRQTDKHTKKVISSDLVSETDFASWYLAYPRHEAKGAARKSYATARKKVDHATLLAGAQRLAANPPSDPKFIPLPASWLNAERWTDEPTHNRAGNGSTAASASGAVVPTRDKSENDWAGILGRFTPDKKFWGADWGRRPDEDGPWLIPPHLVLAWRKQHGVGQKGEVA